MGCAGGLSLISWSIRLIFRHVVCWQSSVARADSFAEQYRRADDQVRRKRGVAGESQTSQPRDETRRDTPPFRIVPEPLDPQDLRPMRFDPNHRIPFKNVAYAAIGCFRRRPEHRAKSAPNDESTAAKDPGNRRAGRPTAKNRLPRIHDAVDQYSPNQHEAYSPNTRYTLSYLFYQFSLFLPAYHTRLY